MNEPRMEIKEINISTFKGFIPAGNDLVVFEKGDEGTALVLYGFDEVGLFDHEFKNPTYGIATNEKSLISWMNETQIIIDEDEMTKEGVL